VDDYTNARRIVDTAARHASPVKPQPAQANAKVYTVREHEDWLHLFLARPILVLCIIGKCMPKYQQHQSIEKKTEVVCPGSLNFQRLNHAASRFQSSMSSSFV
jgi:hypothetical protein